MRNAAIEFDLGYSWGTGKNVIISCLSSKGANFNERVKYGLEEVVWKGICCYEIPRLSVVLGPSLTLLRWFLKQ
jgi:hypothetical protein